ncbi:MAG: flavodoxin-dependent (E)-4-hydroxy-3-methylbut-2-enyl-diphosphate synthase [Candidatus Zixiibacteriota bacterium]|nr:MAG: flavodoxin-dependent (E)-4-hydroxy-3-methylbut-2-enyl-diphosphate synthase [candidate division Zixibacteria bacterium]
MLRKPTRRVEIRGLGLGGFEPVRLQSMTCTATTDIPATLDQIRRLEAAGCELVRLAIPDHEAAAAFAQIRRQTDLPLVADIHFDYRLALEALRAGADKIRLNPGNIGGEERALTVAREAAARGVPIRIGVNSGSVEKDLLAKYGEPTPQALVESALRHVDLLSAVPDLQLVLSLKASDVLTTIEAYRAVSAQTDLPLHLGVTEAGTPFTGAIRSAVGIGTLLAEGLGDTLRVSLTGDVVEEIKVGWEILRSLGLRRRGVELISCPTCGRTEVDLVGIAVRVEKALEDIQQPLRVAVMGCAVNGPGEARGADVGVACGKGKGLIFVRGETVRAVPEERIVEELVAEVRKFLEG